MEQRKPTAAFVLSLLSGVFALLIGIAIAFLAIVLGALFAVGGFFGAIFGALGALVAIYAFLALILGAVLIASSIMLYTHPRKHILWSALIIAFSVISVVFYQVLMALPFILGLIGGIYGMVWKPSPQPIAPLKMPKTVPQPEQPIPTPPIVQKYCTNCGTPITHEGQKFCGNCGAKIE
jgi:hypothetical protein